MLQWSPKNRASARELLNDPWLKTGDLDDINYMTREYSKEWQKARGNDSPSDSESAESDSEAEKSNQDDNDDELTPLSSPDEDVYSDDLGATLMQTVPDATGLNYTPTETDAFTPDQTLDGTVGDMNPLVTE